MKLVIVESPTKAKTIENYLGKDYKVVSTKGALRDLAYTGKGGFGVDINNNFKPNYKLIDGKETILKDLKKFKDKSSIILATDPDREGEAIAWHIAELLGLDINLKNRVAFQEITKDKILSEINNLRQIDINLVRSQEVRRILDRIIGFSLSNIVQTKVGGRSAGRVQSVALKLVVELEKEILAFVPEKYFDIKLYKPIDNKPIDIENNIYLFSADYINIKPIDIKEDIANKILKEAKNPFKVVAINERIANSKAKIPYITSSIQQESFNKYGYSTKKTMLILQNLFEGKEIFGELTGLITYIRTDSTRLSDDFCSIAEDKILKDFGSDYLEKYKNKIKKGKKIQDAHEAIRPASLKYDPESIKKYLEKDEYNIYKLIYERTLSVFMKPSKTKIIDYIFESNTHQFKATSKKNIFKGNQIFEKISDAVIPDYKIGDMIDDFEIVKTLKQTKPKSRYTEASLIKKIEEEGIGRPSTYATIISTLKSRNYVEVENKYMIPTKLGILANDKLLEYFANIINISYTSKMETKLDEIAEGDIDYIKLLTDFYNGFSKLVLNAKENMEKASPIEVGRNCPNCGEKLIYKRSKFGQFIGCSNYPNCNYIEKIKKVGYKKKFSKKDE